MPMLNAIDGIDNYDIMKNQYFGALKMFLTGHKKKLCL